MMNNRDISYHYDLAEHAKALFIFAHGAGADKDHSFMEILTGLLVQKNVSVLRFNFPYMDKRALLGKKYPPNKMPILVECYQHVIDSLLGHHFKEHINNIPLFIGGKSMGGRVAATLAKQYSSEINGVICLGYPFHPIKKTETLRLEPLVNTQQNILVIQGERDALGNKDEVSRYVLDDKCQLSFLPDGDHDLKPRVKSGYTHQHNIVHAINEMIRFIDEN